MGIMGAFMGFYDSCKDLDNMNNKRVAVYVRVSTDKQEADNQIEQLRDYCYRKEWTISKIYLDVASGASNKRPAFEELFLDAHRLGFEIVLFWDLSRFSRSGTLYTLQKLKELEGLGIEWESYQEQYMRSAGAFKDVVLSILSTLAKVERQKISERTKAGLARARNVGKRGKDKRKRSNAGYKERWRKIKRG